MIAELHRVQDIWKHIPVELIESGQVFDWLEQVSFDPAAEVVVADVDDVERSLSTELGEHLVAILGAGDGRITDG